MRKPTPYTVSAIALVVLLAVPFAFAQRARSMHGEGGAGLPMLFGRLLHGQQSLGLSDQQVSDIRAIFQSLREQNAPYHQSLREGLQQIAQTLHNPNDVAAAQALIDQQTGAERAMKANALGATAKALSVLTSDQRAKLSTILQQRMSRGHQR